VIVRAADKIRTSKKKEAVSNVNEHPPTPNNILFFLNLRELGEFFVPFVVKKQTTMGAKVSHYDKILFDCPRCYMFLILLSLLKKINPFKTRSSIIY